MGGLTAVGAYEHRIVGISTSLKGLEVGGLLFASICLPARTLRSFDHELPGGTVTCVAVMPETVTLLAEMLPTVLARAVDKDSACSFRDIACAR